MNIIIARKPLEGNCVSNVLKHCTGGICIDKCRVLFTSEEDRAESCNKQTRKPIRGFSSKEGTLYGSSKGIGWEEPLGRFPANIIHDGSLDELFPDTTSGATIPSIHIHKGGCGNVLSGSKDGSLNNYLPHQNYSPNSGNASRFFYNIGEDSESN